MKPIKYVLVFFLAISLFFLISNRQQKKELNSDTSIQSKKISGDGKTICSDIVAKLATDSGIFKFTGNVKPINFNSFPDAKNFRTAITNSYKQGANFAGHYNLAFWGCGTDCFGMAITDLITGNILEYSPVHEGYYLGGYKTENRLIVMNPVNAGMERKVYKLSETSNKTNVLELVCSEISQEDMYPNPE